MPRTVILTDHIRAALNRCEANHILVVPHPQHFAGQSSHEGNNRLASIKQLADKVLYQNSIATATKLLSFHILAEAAANLGYKDPEGTARAFSATLVQLIRSGADWERIIKEGSVRSRQVARLAKAYLELLHSKQLIEDGEALWEAARIVQHKKELFIYGYSRLEPNELEFINAIADDQSILVLPLAKDPSFSETQKLAEKLEVAQWRLEEVQVEQPTIGEQIADRFIDENLPTPPVTAWEFPNVESEIRSVLAEIKRLLRDGVAENNIALVTENEQDYYPLLMNIAWEYGLAIRIYLEVPIAQMRLGAWLDLLCDCLEENFPFETTLRLLKHTLGGKLDLSAEQMTTARMTHPHGLDAWSIIKPELRGISLPTEGSEKDFIQQLRNILTLFDVKKRCARWASELMAYYEFIHAVSSTNVHRGNVTLSRFLDNVRESLRIITSPVKPGSVGVELHNPASLIGTAYEYVFLIGAMESILPPIIQEDPVLDFYERQELGRIGLQLASSITEVRRKRLEFWSLLNIVTKQLYISYPKLFKNEEQIASPFFAELGLKEFTAPAHFPASLEEWRQSDLTVLKPGEDSVIDAALKSHAVELSRETNPVQDEYDGIVRIPFDYHAKPLSVTQLKTLGQCPFKWFCEHVLELSAPKEVEEDLNPMDVGSLYHRALELLLMPFKEKCFYPDECIGSLEQALEDAKASVEKERRYPIPDWEQRRPELLNILRQAISSTKFLPPGNQIMELEKSSSELLDLVNINIKFTYDRLDRTEEGIEIVDYKSGSTLTSNLVKDANGKLDIDIQLPLYARLIACSMQIPLESITKGRFYSIGQADNLRKTYKYEGYDQQSLINFLASIESLLHEGIYPVAPDIDQTACKYCDYDAVCRRGPRLAIKEKHYGL